MTTDTPGAVHAGAGRHRRNRRLPSALSRTLGATAGRVSWGLADQGVSSITNFAVGIVVARSLGTVEFGIFSLAWVTYTVVLNVSRGLATDPLAVRFSGVSTDSWREAVTRTAGTALLVGGIAGATSLLAGLLVGGPLGAAFVALGIVLPALLLQDSWRFAFFAAGQGHKAFANDLVWAGALVPAMLLASQHGSVTAYLLAWGLSGAVAAVLGAVQARALPRPSGAPSWLRQQRDLGPRYLVENVSVSGGSQIRMYALGAIAGLADVGTVRGAELIMGPFLTVLMGLGLVAVPEAARVLRRSPRRLPLFCLLLGGVQAAGALAWGLGILLLLPDAVGEYVLGSVWAPASALIVPATLAVMGAGLQTGAAAGLRALGAARRGMGSQLFTTSAYVTGGIVGAFAGGALGSAWGVAVAVTLGASLWWWQLRAGLRDHPIEPPERDHDESRFP